jgi:hypothetical protein
MKYHFALSDVLVLFHVEQQTVIDTETVETCAVVEFVFVK